MKVFNTEKGPKPIGPYSQAVKSKDFIFLSGQLPIAPATGNVSGFSIEQQSEQVFKNVKAILEESGSSLKNVVQVTIIMSNLDEFQRMNRVYGSFFTENYPSRTVFQAARIPKDAKIEVSVIAEFEEEKEG